MSKPDVTFVNAMTVSGFHNGNVNLSFTTARFTAIATDAGAKVDTDEYPSAYLRFDLDVARQIRDALDKILAEQTKPPGPAN